MDKRVAIVALLEQCWFQILLLRRRHQRRVAQVVRLHDGGIERSEIQGCNGNLIVVLDRIQHSCTFITVPWPRNTTLFERRNQERFLSALPQNHGENLDLLASCDQVRHGHPSHARHFDVVDEDRKFVHQSLGKESILQTIRSQPMAVLIRTILQVRNNGMMYIFLLLTKILGTDAIQGVAGQLVVSLHVGKHVENDTPVNGGFHIGSFSVRRRLKGRLLHFGWRVSNFAPLAKATELVVVLGKRLGPVQEIGNVEILHVITCNNVGIACF
mmetsp:Transcript_7938/g.11598  ORF Transcript_7938/g.11598 Transcript_7938/m.11598 type:complete len:271 (-) Transcript_7938:121-933(-)